MHTVGLGELFNEHHRDVLFYYTAPSGVALEGSSGVNLVGRYVGLPAHRTRAGNSHLPGGLEP